MAKPENRIRSFERRCSPEPNTGCWIWLGTMHETGYGKASIDGRPTRAHRVSFSLFVGPIPAGLMVLHRCDNRWCVNPRHLFLGTQTDNMRDMARKGRAVKSFPGRRGKRLGFVAGIRRTLTAEDVSKIRKEALAGARHRDLARKYRTSKSTISRACSRETFDWVV